MSWKMERLERDKAGTLSVATRQEDPPLHSRSMTLPSCMPSLA
jgi:hypothetical protein